MILDSSILIAEERGRFALQDFFAAHSSDSYYLAAITVSELWHGVERAVPSTRRQAREVHLRQRLIHLNVLPFDADVARRHATLWAELEVRGTPMGAHDLLIATTAVHHGHALATLNQNEFLRVRELQLVDVAPHVRPAAPR